MEYKVCILAAGDNKHVSYAKDFHISLLPIGTKSTLTKIIVIEFKLKLGD